MYSSRPVAAVSEKPPPASVRVEAVASVALKYHVVRGV